MTIDWIMLKIILTFWLMLSLPVCLFAVQLLPKDYQLKSGNKRIKTIGSRKYEHYKMQ